MPVKYSLVMEREAGFFMVIINKNTKRGIKQREYDDCIGTKWYWNSNIKSAICGGRVMTYPEQYLLSGQTLEAIDLHCCPRASPSPVQTGTGQDDCSPNRRSPFQSHSSLLNTDAWTVHDWYVQTRLASIFTLFEPVGGQGPSRTARSSMAISLLAPLPTTASKITCQSNQQTE